MKNGKEKSPNSLLMHSLYAVADMGTGPELMKLYVEEMNDPNNRDTAKRAYQLQGIERRQLGAKGSGKRPSPVTQTADIANIADLFDAVKHWDSNFKPKPASQVVNEDGTPKAVYHGTDQDFWTFDPEQGAYFFSEYEDYAEAMMEERGGDRILSAYLNLKNPYEVTLPPNQFSDNVAERPHIRYAKKNGYDGVIFRNDTDDPLAMDTFYVAFRPEQIKAAEDNVGTFDGSNPDIRYSARGGNRLRESHEDKDRNGTKVVSELTSLFMVQTITA